MVATQSRSDKRQGFHAASLTTRRRVYRDTTTERSERLYGGWGGAVIRTGGTVRRSTGDWTPAVHALLTHLESAGFDGSPRVFGVDAEGREVLSFIEGQTVATAASWPEWARSESNLVRVGSMLRRFHDAVETFRPDPELTWRSGRSGLEPGEIIGHNDVSLANLVADSDGRIHSLIDWDNAGPTTRRKDLAIAAWHVVALHAPAHAEARGWTRQPDVARRLRIFLDAYGLTDRTGFVDDILDRLGHALTKLSANGGCAEFVKLLQADIAFIESNREALERAIA
ncbi:phosphotransferase [Smaragdicoccus niigatensis]|uniref:phosphotransferase n=1 Tax=Smaragdicoccus niigatensis TaxID=359359 RepID=UPI0003684346|nr:phosphotransferase [Smaragdicoccus niigatensis]